MRVVPTGPTTVNTEYQVFRNPESSMEIFQRAADFFEGIELEDYDLMNGVQRNLSSGVYVQGPLHTQRESGVAYFKTLVQQELHAHARDEAKAGHEIWPAKRNQQLHGTVQEQEEFAEKVCACGIASGCA